MNNILILENIRSAYNVGTMIRTADALWYDIVISWYTPHPQINLKVLKSSLWAEESVNIHHFRNPVEALDYVYEQWYVCVVGELWEWSVALNEFKYSKKIPIAILVWNEATGVLQETIDRADHCVYIPMKGIKESLNVAEAASILMWELR